MKPIIIEVKDNKIVMDVKEFKKHIEDAYQQGYRDGGSCSTTGNPYWWRDLTYPTPTLSGVNITGGSVKGVVDPSITLLGHADKLTATTNSAI